MDSVNQNTSEQLARDPVCGMTVDPRKAAGSFEYNGQTYFFCSIGCLEKFKADPDRFLNGPSGNPTGIQGRRETEIRKAEYTCPMHPQIMREGPGSCPICGMALEPRVFSGAEENTELVDMRRRFWVSA